MKVVRFMAKKNPRVATRRRPATPRTGPTGDDARIMSIQHGLSSSYARSAPIVRIQRNIVVTEVRRQQRRAGRAAAEVDGDGDAFAGEDPRGVLFAVGGGLAVADERDRADGEGDALDREARAAATDGGKDAAPVRVAAVQRGLDQRRRGDGVRGQAGVALG